MAQTNLRNRTKAFTHEGGRAFAHITPAQQLRRSVLSCLLWEDTFYEDGEQIAGRIAEYAEQVDPLVVAALAIEAREVFDLRHAPLLLLEVLTRTGRGRIDALVAGTIARVIQRADELGEFVAIYTHGGDRRAAEAGRGRQFSAQAREGLRLACNKFNEYHLAKYDRDGAVKLRDVLRIARPKPKGDVQSALWKRTVTRTLVTPDTWEVELSAGKAKKETFERLIRDGNIGYLALLRNLRNMLLAGCDTDLIRDAILARKGAQRVLPFRYVAAARAVPQLEPELNRALLHAIKELPALDGKTIALVDVSGSMSARLSGKSDMRQVEAAAALASILPGDLRVFVFADAVAEIPPRRGMAGVDAICGRLGGMTYLGSAVHAMNALPHDRLIVVTDEQSHDTVPDPVARYAYMINVAAMQHGVGYGRWTHLDGFSEGVLRFIHEHERQEAAVHD